MSKESLNGNKDNYTRGVLYIILSGLCFSLMNAAVRFAGELPSMQKCLFRNGIALIIACVYMLLNHVPLRCEKGNAKLLIGRAAFGTLGMICNYYAVDHMNIGDASLLNKICPFVALCCAAVFLKERFTAFHLFVVIGAFIGCAFVIQPSMDFDRMAPALVATLGGVGAGVAMAFVRALGRKNENSIRVIFYFSVFSTSTTLPLFLINAVPMSRVQLITMLFAGIMAGFGQLFITKAYYYAPPKDISVFDFSQVLFSALFGFLFFQQIPNRFGAVGYILIISMGVLLFCYNRRPQID